jgi:hypothetical protein
MGKCQICGTSTGDRSRFHRRPQDCDEGIAEAITDHENQISALKALRALIGGMKDGDTIEGIPARRNRMNRENGAIGQ